MITDNHTISRQFANEETSEQLIVKANGKLSEKLIACVLLPILMLSLLVGCTKIDREDGGSNGSIGGGGEYEKGNLLVRIVMDDTDGTFDGAAGDTVKGAVLGYYCQRLSVAFFEDDQRISLTHQSADGPVPFGDVVMNMPAGTYRVVAVGHNGEGNPSINNPERVSFPNNRCTDTFVGNGEITIPDSLTDQMQCFTLRIHRVTACMNIVITGEFPREVKKMKFYYTGGSSTLNALTGFGCVNSRQTEIIPLSNTSSSGITSASGNNPVQTADGMSFRIWTFPHDSWDEVSVFAYALDSTDRVVYEREFLPLAVGRGHTTVYSHRFFPGW